MFYNMMSYALPSFVLNGFSAFKSFFQGEQNGQQAVTAFTGAVAKDGAYELTRMAAKHALTRAVPSFQYADIASKTAVKLATDGFSAVYKGEYVPKTIAKGTLATVNNLVAGPVMAIPLTYATDYLVEKADDVCQVGIMTAYGNFRNTQSFKDLGYNADVSRGLIAKDIKDDELSMSFCNLSRSVCAA